MTHWGKKVTCLPPAWFTVLLRGFQPEWKDIYNSSRLCEVMWSFEEIKYVPVFSLIVQDILVQIIFPFFLLILQLVCILEMSAF